jgi:hypothetical protein
VSGVNAVGAKASSAFASLELDGLRNELLEVKYKGFFAIVVTES